MFERFKEDTDFRPLKIMIVGCGKVGSTLVEQLSQEGNDITVVDTNAHKVADLTNLYDIMGYVGNGGSYSVLKEAGVDTMDLLIAVTHSDELNLLCCTVGNRMGNCATIARVRKPDYSNEIGYLRDKLGLAMIINPDLEAAREISRILYLPTALEVNSFAHGEAEMIKVKIPEGSPLANNTLMEFGKKTDIKNMVFCAVERQGEVTIPNGSFTFLAGDIVSFAVPRRFGRASLKKLGIITSQVHDCIIIGGGVTAYYLAKQLIHNNISVKIIESNAARCDELSLLLPEAIIINGDGTDPAILKEEGLQTTEALVPLTGIDEENIFLTLHANKMSNAKVVTKVNRFAFRDVLNGLDLGSIIYPRYLTAEAIVGYARARRASVENCNIETLYHMFDQRVEAIEFSVFDSSEVTGVPLMNLNLKDNLVLAFINRNGKIIIPSGSDTIEIGDTFMVVTTNTGFNEITDILK